MRPLKELIISTTNLFKTNSQTLKYFNSLLELFLLNKAVYLDHFKNEFEGSSLSPRVC